MNDVGEHQRLVEMRKNSKASGLYGAIIGAIVTLVAGMLAGVSGYIYDFMVEKDAFGATPTAFKELSAKYKGLDESYNQLLADYELALSVNPTRLDYLELKEDYNRFKQEYDEQARQLNTLNEEAAAMRERIKELEAENTSTGVDGGTDNIGRYFRYANNSDLVIINKCVLIGIFAFIAAVILGVRNDSFLVFFISFLMIFFLPAFANIAIPMVGDLTILNYIIFPAIMCILPIWLTAQLMEL